MNFTDFWCCVQIEKKQDTEGNSEDNSKGYPEENTARVQHWRGTKR